MNFLRYLLANPLLERERQSWKQHRVVKDNSTSSLSMIEEDTMIQLCYYESQMYGLSYKHYFLQFLPSGCIAEFRGADHFNAIFKIHNETIEGELFIDTDKNTQFTPEWRERLREVENMSNYSLLLRNCEHITRYVFSGKWRSYQVVSETKNSFQMFISQADRTVRKLINRRPESLGSPRAVANVAFEIGDRWNFTPNERVNVYSDEGGFNVLLLGPTGSGKSNLINHIYRKDIAESRRSTSSVTQQVQFYPGTFNGSQQTQYKNKICIIDTVGFCDENIATTQIIKVVISYLRNQRIHIHRVLIVFGDRVRDAELEALRSYKTSLNFEKYAELFTLVLTKCDDIEGDELEAYANSFHNISDFATFYESCRGMSLLTGENVFLKRTVTVGLKDFNKVKDNYDTELCEQRERLLGSIFALQDNAIVLDENCFLACIKATSRKLFPR